MLKLDEYGQALNCFETARFVIKNLEKGKAVALPLALGNITLFHISFVPLFVAIPDDCKYYDGSQHGVQINIDRCGSYALPLNSSVGEGGYLSQKLNISRADANTLLPFINTILTKKNHFKQAGESKKAQQGSNEKNYKVASEKQRGKSLATH